MAVSRRVRAAWVIGGSVFTVATLGFGTLQAVAGLAHEERSYTTTISDPVRALDIRASGSVTVVGTDGATVTIDERVSDGLQHPDRSTDLNQGVLYLRGTCSGFPETFCGDDFIVRVPHAVSVRVQAEGVRVSSVRGGVSVTSDGGDVQVRGATGELWLQSHGGDIEARALGVSSVNTKSYGGNTTLSFRSPPGRVTASSQGGNILFVLPRNPVSYRVEASADGGSTGTAIRTDPTSSHVLRASSSGGEVSIRYVSEPDTG
jgi:hypothetical protein